MCNPLTTPLWCHRALSVSAEALIEAAYCCTLFCRGSYLLYRQSAGIHNQVVIAPAARPAVRVIYSQFSTEICFCFSCK